MLNKLKLLVLISLTSVNKENLVNENRSIFALHGLTGMFIAVALLLSILAGLTVLGLGVQNANASKFYEVKDETSIKMFGSDASTHRVMK